MMTQEEFMDVMAMKRQGLSIKEIAEETGYHPSTISNWLKNGGPTERRSSVVPAVIDERWSARIAELVRAAPRLLATSVFELIRAGMPAPMRASPGDDENDGKDGKNDHVEHDSVHHTLSFQDPATYG
jgi:hypothetical protein